jgi:hypothetical protein
VQVGRIVTRLTDDGRFERLGSLDEQVSRHGLNGWDGLDSSGAGGHMTYKKYL